MNRTALKMKDRPGVVAALISINNRKANTIITIPSICENDANSLIHRYILLLVCNIIASLGHHFLIACLQLLFFLTQKNMKNTKQTKHKCKAPPLLDQLTFDSEFPYSNDNYLLQKVLPFQ